MDNDFNGFYKGWRSPMEQNATHRSVRASDSDAEQTKTRREPHSTPSSWLFIAPKPSLPSRSRLGFTSFYNPQDPTALRRMDAFYELAQGSKSNAVTLTFHTMAKPQPIRTQGSLGPEQLEVHTAMIVPRLMFPARSGDLDAFGWADIGRRNEAAERIDTQLGILYSEGTLSGCVAASNFRTYRRLLNGDGNTFRRQLGTYLRKENAVPTSDVRSSAPTGPATLTSKVPESLTVKVGSDIITLNIWEAAKGTDSRDWKEDEYYPNLKTQLKPPPNRKLTMESTILKTFEEEVRESIKSQSHITKEARCVFGNVVLCGLDAPRTVATSSSAAAS
jgi:hypothetical protein